MANKEDTIKTKLAVDGEKEYKEACKGINGSLREIGSEMRLVSAEFADNAKSTQALTAKQDVLKKQLAEQAQKVKAAEDALRKMKEKGLDETNPAVQRMQTNLNNAKAEMVKTEKQLDSISGELKQSKVNWEAVGGVVGKAGKAFGTTLAALGTAAVGAASALAGLTVSASNYADDLLTQSTFTRQTTDDLQKYAYAARFVDVDMNTLTKSMGKNIKSMDSARKGSAAYADAYKKLGVSVTGSNGELRDSNEVYWECIDALGNVQNETERDALAMQLFGKSAQELNSVIDAGSETFKGLGDEAEEMGFIMGEEAVKSLGAFNDKLQVLTAGMDGLKNSASLIALPFLDVLAGEGITILKDFSKGIQQANGDVSKMGGVVGKGISDVLNLIVQNLPGFVNMGVEMVKSLISGIVTNAPTLAAAAVQIVETLVNGIASLLPIIITGAVQIVAGLARGLGESLPQLLPQAVKMVTAIVQALIDNIPMLIEAALQLVLGLANGLIAAIPVLINALPTIIESLINGLLASIPKIIQAGIDLLTSLVTALPQIIQSIVKAIPQIIAGLVTAVMNNIPLIVQAGIDLLTSLIDAMPQIYATIVAAIPKIVGGIVNAFAQNIDKIIVAGVQLLTSLVKSLPKIVATVAKAVPTIIKGLVQAFGGYIGEMSDVGLNLIKGVWEGIKGAAKWLKDNVKGFFQGIVKDVKGVLGIHSPSKVFAEIGGFMAAGLGKGFDGEMKAVGNDVQRSLSGLTGNLQTEIELKKPATNRRQGRAGVGDVYVTQNIYANETNYAKQQREAAKQFKMIAREVVA